MRSHRLALAALLLSGCLKGAGPSEPAPAAGPEATRGSLPPGAAEPALRAAIVSALQREAGPEFAVDASLRARNPAHGLEVAFDAGGARLSGPAGMAPWAVRLSTAGYGCAGAVGAVEPAGVAAAGNRVAYRRPSARFEEWWLNGPLGLEFGWTIPGDPGCGQVVFEVAVEGAVPSLEGRGASLRRGAAALARVSEALAVDAAGRALPARLALAGGRLQLRVEVQGARFPVSVDPLVTTEAQRVAPATDANGEFGWAVAVDGTTAAVGAPLSAHSAAMPAQCCSASADCRTGAVWVFVRGATGWALQARLERPVGEAFENEYFGSALDLSGDTLVVGAYQADANVPTGTPGLCFAGSGAAFVFVRSGTTWTQAAKLAAADGSRGDEFGRSVAIDGTTIVVGAPKDSTGAGSTAVAEHGAAYAFVRSGASWVQQQKLVASDPRAFDWFGSAVDVSADTALVGAPCDAATQARAGSAYAFVRSGSAWSEQALLQAADGGADDEFGGAVSLEGETAAVGAQSHDHGLADSGAAYLFVRSGAAWTQQQEVRASDAAAGDRFGRAVCLEGEGLAVGASRASLNGPFGPLDAWKNAYASAPFMVGPSVTTPAFQVSAGANRLLVVAVLAELGTADTLVSGTTTASYGGVPLTRAAWTQSRSSTQHAALYYLREASLPVGPQSLTVRVVAANSRVVTGLQIFTASYQGVRQDLPFGDSAFNTSAATSVSFGSAVDYPAGALTLFVAANGGAAATLTAPAGFSSPISNAANGFSTFVASTPVHAAAGTHASTTSVAFSGTAAAASAVVAGALSPLIESGAAYYATRQGGVWTERGKYGAAAPGAFAHLGTAVALAAGTVLAGAPFEDVGAANQAGAGYFFAIPGGACTLPGDCPAGLTCVDGVCCSTPCDQPCQRCDSPGSEGWCQPVAGAEDPGSCEGTRQCSAAGACLLLQGQPCPGGDATCLTGRCVDGLCCDTACSGACESCAVAGHLGSCTPFAPGTDPENDCPGGGECAAACDGAGACAFPGASVACGNTYCLGAVYTPAGVCDEGGGCLVTPVACPGHLVCAPSGLSCLTSCAAPADCQSGTWCEVATGLCRLPGAAGTACAQGSECAGGRCVDGFCCQSECAGACERCDVAGHLGACWPSEAGTDPDNDCPGGGTCASACDGAGACALPGPSVQCAPASCAGSTLTLADTCDGAGTCADRGTAPCPGLLRCDPGGAACRASCASNSDCVEDTWCDLADGSCRAKHLLGEACTADGQCLDAACRDGFCCDGPCDGLCERCDAFAHEGRCWPIADGADLQEECPGTGVCGGVCDGARACRTPGTDVVCVAASCAEALAVPEQRCDGAGGCLAAPEVPCGAYACDGTACGTACADDSDCAGGHACATADHACRLAAGAACDADAECASGACAGGRCCAGACAHADAACGGACDQAGQCSYPTTATACGLCRICDGNGACLGTPADDPTCPVVPCAALSDACTTYADLAGNRCASFGACKAAPGDCAPAAFAADGTPCGAPACASGTETRRLCDGAGECVSTQVGCAPYACGADGACRTACAADADCAAGLACHLPSGACRGAKGDACQSGSQCASGSCVDGVCCQTACAGACERCDLASSRGTCAPVAAGQDPDAECAGEGTCGGACDGAGACAFPGASSACGLCLACDSAGACGQKPADDPACGAIACSALSTECRAYTDLVANRCVAAGACLMPDRLSCTAYSDQADGTACTCEGGAAGACAAGSCECLPGSDAGTVPDAAAPSGPDAASPAVPDGSASARPDAATPGGGDAGGTTSAPAGCGCGEAPGGSAGGAVALALAVALGASRRRRRGGALG